MITWPSLFTMQGGLALFSWSLATLAPIGANMSRQADLAVPVDNETVALRAAVHLGRL